MTHPHFFPASLRGTFCHIHVCFSMLQYTLDFASPTPLCGKIMFSVSFFKFGIFLTPPFVSARTSYMAVGSPLAPTPTITHLLQTTACGHRIAHRKWKETKLHPGTAGPGNMLGCCFFLSISCGPSYVRRLYVSKIDLKIQ